MDRGDDDVRGHVFRELDDHLGQVSLPRFDPVLFQMLVEVDFLGCHRLDLDNFVHSLGGNEVERDCVGLFGVARPVDHAAALGDVFFELLEEPHPVGCHGPLDVRRRFAKAFPIGHLLDPQIALGPDLACRIPEIAPHLRVLEGLVSSLGKMLAPLQRIVGNRMAGMPAELGLFGVFLRPRRGSELLGEIREGPHHAPTFVLVAGANQGDSSVPARTSARCIDLMPEPDRARPPPMFIRHE